MRLPPGAPPPSGDGAAGSARARLRRRGEPAAAAGGGGKGGGGEMKRFHAGVALLLSLLWEVRWAVGGALPCDSRGSPRGVRHRSRPGAERLAERSCSPHPAGRRAREVVYFAVNACAGAGLAPQAVRGQECGGAAGPGWAGRDPARLRCHGRSPCPGSCCWSRGRLSGVMEQNNAGPVRRGASCWKLPIPNRLADCPGDAKSAPVSTG